MSDYRFKNIFLNKNDILLRSIVALLQIYEILLLREIKEENSENPTQRIGKFVCVLQIQNIHFFQALFQ